MRSVGVHLQATQCYDLEDFYFAFAPLDTTATNSMDLCSYGLFSDDADWSDSLVRNGEMAGVVKWKGYGRNTKVAQFHVTFA